MCGLFGLYRPGGLLTESKDQTAVQRCLHTMRHRGPDGSGFWTDPEAGIALGHLRLAVLELSPLGDQPMVSPSGRYVLIYNGEIYNFAALQLELEARGYKFPGHSDTAVFLAGFEEWGIAETCRRANGMFAFAVWDRKKCRLVFGRDQFGQKPLYYGWVGDVLLFGSELKSLAAYPGFAGRIDRDALTLFLRHCYVPHPRTIWHGIRKLSPGCILELDQTHLERRSTPEPFAFWSAIETARLGLEQPFCGDKTEAREKLEAIAKDAVRQCMVSDVPIGVFLSGGTDSSLIAALMQYHSARPVRSFSVGFEDAEFDESHHAHAVARHLGTEHTELRVAETDALDVIPRLSSIYDEPFADSSQIPTCLVSRLARTHVTVSLTGDAGDEVFAGYNRYVWSEKLAGTIDHMPAAARRLFDRFAKSISPSKWHAIGAIAATCASQIKINHIAEKVEKFADAASAADIDEAYLRLTSIWQDPTMLTGSDEPARAVLDLARRIGKQPVAARMMLADTLTYLPDDILTKVDRASMAASLESRAPYLDTRLFSFAWQLPMAFKLNARGGKDILREILDAYVPRQIMDRPKAGFAVPLGRWLRGPLRAWAEDLLQPQKLETDGGLSAQPIRQAWLEHVSGRRNHHHRLWAILMYQSWLDTRR